MKQETKDKIKTNLNLATFAVYDWIVAHPWPLISLAMFGVGYITRWLM